MRKITLFIAMSLDGYIADRDGRVDWLQGQEPGKDDMESYHDFIREIDTVIMGWNTYRQITEELSPGAWPYGDMTSYILTHRQLPAEEHIRFVTENVCNFVSSLKREEGNGIWICGGANMLQPLIRENIIDVYHISIIPSILGGGVRLFAEMETEHKLKLIRTGSYNGITDVIYERR